MTPQTEPKIVRLPIADIAIKDRLRPVKKAGVESLKKSILELGVIKDAIHVRQKGRGDKIKYELIAGGHRLAAATDLEWEDIPTRIWVDVTDDFCRLMEIDDNLAGSDLSALELSVFLAERKRVYEKLHPETRANVAGGQAAQAATDLEGRFPAITAAANETLAAVRSILETLALALQSTDHSTDGANIVQSIAAGMLGQLGAIQSAAAQISATIRNSLSQSVGVNVRLAAAGQPEGLPRRDAGGPVRPGFMYEVNERGQEFFVPGMSGSILPARVAQAAAAASMAAMPAAGMATEAQITHIIDQRPALSAQAPAAPQQRAGDNITFHIQAAPGMDPEAIAQEVERILEQRDADRRGDLFDGGAY